MFGAATGPKFVITPAIIASIEGILTDFSFLLLTKLASSDLAASKELSSLIKWLVSEKYKEESITDWPRASDF